MLQNRRFSVESEIASTAKSYIIEHYSVNIKDCDIIIGYRADDSYFAYARDFIQNTISLKRLSQVMRLGKLGNQIVLKSEKAFKRINFLQAIPTQKEVYYPRRKVRDDSARLSYLDTRVGSIPEIDDIMVLDIIRGSVKPDDPRLQ